MVDWQTVRLKVGDWVCPEHGTVRPWRQIVPACPECLRALTRAVLDKGGKLAHVEPIPARCAGPDRHPLSPGNVLLNARACLCASGGQHRAWTCVTCGNVQEWPPHDVASSTPYFGPGADR